jgi:Phosphotransferase enzyme family
VAVATVAGALHAVPDPQLPDHLTLLTSSAGWRFVSKQHRDRGRYERERDAYQTYGPQLGRLAPRLMSADDEQMALLLVAIDAEPATHLEPGSPAEACAYRAAGAALACLHRIRPAEAPPMDLPASLANRLRAWVGKATQARLVSADERTLLLRTADTIATTPLEAAPCHLDYQPQNWLIRPNGRLIIIDFEHSRIDARIRDFARLAHRHWIGRDDLRDAFLDGYGQHLTSAEELLLGQFAAFEAVTALVRGTERADPNLIGHGRTVLTRLAEATRS